MWSQGWSQVNRDEAPFQGTPDSPGVCDVGGNKQACIETDRIVSKDLQQLVQNLTTTVIPREFASATDAITRGLRLAIQGLNDRDLGISGDDTNLFRQGQDELARAISLIGQGYSQFPGYDRPDPTPFAGK